MKMSLIKWAGFIAFGFLLSACSTFSTFTSSPQPKGITVASSDEGQVGIMSGEQVPQGAAIAGNLEGFMDSTDKAKMSKALDGGLGKATHWANGATGVSYTVIPLQKVTIGGNTFCRTYSIAAEKSGNVSKMNGTACLASDGAWHRA